MINGLAIWHYPHRTMCENIEYFASCGYDAVSVIGGKFAHDVEDATQGAIIADTVSRAGVVLTVHAKLPDDHSEAKNAEFIRQVNAVANWQARYGLISIYSFDVPEAIRDNIAPYVDYVIATVPSVKVAVEDFGLNENERAQIEHLKSNSRFGYLIDIGHMFLRIRGENRSGYTLFTNSPDECAVNESPYYDDFMTAFKSKEFPIFEIHLHNNDGVSDLHLFLEDGPLDIAMIARVIRDIGFEGVLTVESAPGYHFECSGDDADIGIARTYQYWKSCI